MTKKGSIPPCGAFCGSILAAASLHFIGRKYTIVVASPFAAIGWALIATATRFEVIIGARFLTGFCVGLCLPAAQVYVNCIIELHLYICIFINAVSFSSEWKKLYKHNHLLKYTLDRRKLRSQDTWNSW